MRVSGRSPAKETGVPRERDALGRALRRHLQILFSKASRNARRLGVGSLAFTIATWAGCAGNSDGRQTPWAETVGEGPVVLGTDWMTSGIPGTGPLTLNEIEDWLRDERNHRPLEVRLPLGLADAGDEMQIPSDNPLTLAKIELGRQLFFDKRLSGIGTFSCATCHQPKQSYSSYQVMPEVARNASAVFNRILGSEHFWDGRADSLEAQPHSPVSNPFEMNSSPEKTTAHIAAIPGYARQFEVIFGEVSFENICRALASFERVIVTSAAPWDYHRLLRERTAGGDDSSVATEALKTLRLLAARHPMSEAAIRGEALFFSDRSGCANCHTGVNLTDESYHNLGVGVDASSVDRGRMKVTGDPADFGAFKTPSLRNVAKTPPYMHNGQFRSLEEVVEFLDQGGYLNENRSPLIRPLGLTMQEKADLVEFLGSLTSALAPVETERLPE